MKGASTAVVTGSATRFRGVWPSATCTGGSTKSTVNKPSHQLPKYMRQVLPSRKVAASMALYGVESSDWTPVAPRSVQVPDSISAEVATPMAESGTPNVLTE